MHILRVGCALNWTHNIIHTPISSTSILSRPTGPKELFTILAMEQAAITGTNKQKMHCEKDVHITVFVLWVPPNTIRFCVISQHCSCFTSKCSWVQISALILPIHTDVPQIPGLYLRQHNTYYHMFPPHYSDYHLMLFSLS